MTKIIIKLWNSIRSTKLAKTLLTRNRAETLTNRATPWPYSTVPRPMEPRVFYGFKLTAPWNNRSNGFWLKAHGAVRFRWHSYGGVRCGFKNRESYGPVRCGFQVLEILRCGSVLWCILRCGSVRFGAVFKCREPYGAVRLYCISYGAVRCGFPISSNLRCGAVRSSRGQKSCGAVRCGADNRTEPIGKTAP